MAYNQNVELVGPYQSCAPGATGATSFSFTAPAAGIYSLDWKLELPRLSQGGGQSGVIVTITNATGPVTVFSSIAGSMGGKVDTLCAAGDIVKFELSSVTAADLTTVNNVKATLAVASGV